MEQWCTDNAANCIMSEPFQSTSYSTASSGGNYIAVLGNDSTKQGKINQPVSLTASIAHQDGVANGTFGASFDISTSSAILNLLPNRDVSAVARFLKSKDTFDDGVYRFGYAPFALGTTIKRIALRWYAYYTPTYDFAFDNSCTNGKLFHVSQTTWGSNPFLTVQSYHNDIGNYSFIPAGWHWTGAPGGWADFFGWKSPGNGYDLNNFKGKWHRHEVIVRRPRTADSNTGGLGFDYEYYLKNVTDDTPEVKAVQFSNGSTCTSCIDAGSPSNFSWNTTIYPTADINSIHTETYRAGTCAGWQGWLYAAAAAWTTDAGTERIGAASEMEGGGAAPAATASRTMSLR